MTKAHAENSGLDTQIAIELARSDHQAVSQRAVAPGNSLAALDAPNHLEPALQYCEFAGAQSHQPQLRARAKKPGDSALERTHYTRASEYYQFAGLDGLADEVLERGEAGEETAEESRQERFRQYRKTWNVSWTSSIKYPLADFSLPL